MDADERFNALYQAHTPTLIGPDGTVYAMNNATPVRHRPLAQAESQNDV